MPDQCAAVAIQASRCALAVSRTLRGALGAPMAHRAVLSVNVAAAPFMRQPSTITPRDKRRLASFPTPPRYDPSSAEGCAQRASAPTALAPTASAQQRSAKAKLGR